MKAREVKGREEGEVKLYSSRRKEEKGGIERIERSVKGEPLRKLLNVRKRKRRK